MSIVFAVEKLPRNAIKVIGAGAFPVRLPVAPASRWCGAAKW
jgi:hypothetical protein